ncbi:uncharacterized protein A1O5_03560 [Cladophialophora psammophila CBS 110553]|uniref:Rad51-like C-terminal domain-containing protein n=1 Tax=Cladophialophora psammophila CBS 110553 TaxID=1182543 RepID=W9X0S5_9EURO|nr:uncharacterized protein A1O5_03560 [Cladophialophora psammophila CBS 110553]EXJ73798.1 hypothetical protein A1O5_03560 [Cladophialophora psammophila CBS 110553]
MSAGQYGARLLEEVKEETLEQFLAELRCSIDPRPRSVLGVPQLDNLLESLRYPAAERTPGNPQWPSSSTPTSPALDDNNNSTSEGEQSDNEEISPCRPPLRAFTDQAKPATIELSSAKSASGKTSLLSYLCAISVLPRDLGGNESMAVYVDADGRFSATRLAQIMHHCIQLRLLCIEAGTPSAVNPVFADSGNIQQTIRSSLDHVHVFRPQSSGQLISILSSLHTYLLDRSRHRSMHRPLGLIVLDSATAFYWQDRADQAMARLELPPSATAAEGQRSRAAETIAKLKALQERFECAVLLSTTTATTTSTPFSSPSTRTQHETTSANTPPEPANSDTRVISPWTSYATLSLLLARTPVSQFPPQMGIEECLRDRDRRLEAVRRGRFVATFLGGAAPVRAHGRGERERQSEGGRGGGGGGWETGAFGFRSTADGVEIE